MHTRNAAALLRSGSGGQRVYFSSLRAAAESLASFSGCCLDGQPSRGGAGGAGGEPCWHTRLLEWCLEKQALEANAKTLVVDDDDDQEEGEELGDGMDDGDDGYRVGRSRRRRPRRRRRGGGQCRGGGGPARLVVEDLTGQVTWAREPCAHGSLADVWGELTLPRAGCGKTRVSVSRVVPISSFSNRPDWKTLSCFLLVGMCGAMAVGVRWVRWLGGREMYAPISGRSAGQGGCFFLVSGLVSLRPQELTSPPRLSFLPCFSFFI